MEQWPVRKCVVLSPKTEEILEQIMRQDFPHSRRARSLVLRQLLWKEGKQRGLVVEGEVEEYEAATASI